MKAVVLEIKDGYAAVLKEDGTVIKIKRQCRVGDTIILTKAEMQSELKSTVAFPKKARKIIAAAAVLFLVFMGGGSYYMLGTSYASVVVDNGYSTVTLHLNHFDQVIGVEAEEDSEAVESLQQSGIRFDSMTDALDKVNAYLQTKAASGTEESDSADQTSETADQGQQMEVTGSALTIGIAAADDQVFNKLKNQAEQFGFTVNRVGTESTASGNIVNGSNKSDPVDMENITGGNATGLIGAENGTAESQGIEGPQEEPGLVDGDDIQTQPEGSLNSQDNTSVLPDGESGPEEGTGSVPGTDTEDITGAGPEGDSAPNEGNGTMPEGNSGQNEGMGMQPEGDSAPNTGAGVTPEGGSGTFTGNGFTPDGNSDSNQGMDFVQDDNSGANQGGRI